MKPNEITLFTLSLIFILPILIFNNLFLDIIILAIAILNLLILKKFKFKFLLWFLIVIILPLISVFITTILYTKSPEHSVTVHFLGVIKTTDYAIKLAFFLTIRTFCLSFISVSYLVALEYDDFILELMQNLKLPVSIGYSLLITFNAFYYLKDEFIRMKNIYLMRFGKKKNILLLIFPMIVSASRFAFYAGLSLQSRGLNKNKTYLKRKKWKHFDIYWIIINLIFVIVIIYYFSAKTDFSIKLM